MTMISLGMTSQRFVGRPGYESLRNSGMEHPTRVFMKDIENGKEAEQNFPLSEQLHRCQKEQLLTSEDMIV